MFSMSFYHFKFLIYLSATQQTFVLDIVRFFSVFHIKLKVISSILSGISCQIYYGILHLYLLAYSLSSGIDLAMIPCFQWYDLCHLYRCQIVACWVFPKVFCVTLQQNVESIMHRYIVWLLSCENMANMSETWNIIHKQWSYFNVICNS